MGLPSAVGQQLKVCLSPVSCPQGLEPTVLDHERFGTYWALRGVGIEVHAFSEDDELTGSCSDLQQGNLRPVAALLNNADRRVVTAVGGTGTAGLRQGRNPLLDTVAVECQQSAELGFLL